MGRLRIVPIVEGDGEYESIRILLERIWYEQIRGEYIEVVRPVRQSRGKLLQEAELRRIVRLALGLLNEPPTSDDPALVLILVDSERDCPAVLGPALLAIGGGVDPRADVACVLAHVMFETWFVAAAESLGGYLDTDVPPDNPEAAGLGKSWISNHFRFPKYRETQHQPAMTRAMDLNACRARSPSFDKLCRELEQRMTPRGASE